MNVDEIKQVAWVGDAFVSRPIKAVIVTFHGLGASGLKNGPGYEESEWAAAGALIVHPYYGPWSWMNRQARTFVDELIPAVRVAYDVPKQTPLLIVGGSMGGLSALIYTRYSPHRIAACLAMVPVCDLQYHFGERPDLPPTIHHAFRGYPQDMQTLFDEHSPLKQAASMPRIPYLVIHGDADLAVNKAMHSDRFVPEMRKAGHNIEYVEVPGMGHGTNVPHAVYRKQIDWLKSFIGSGK